jgi:hypothetical protein
MNRYIISLFILAAIFSCNKNDITNATDKHKIRSMLYIINGSPNDTFFEFYSYDNSGKHSSSILKLNSTGSPLDGYDSFSYLDNKIIEHYKFLNQNKKITYFLQPGTNLLDSLSLNDLNTNDRGRMIFYRNGNYLDSMYCTYYFTRGDNTLINFMTFKYKNDELSEMHAYTGNEMRLFNFRIKINYNYAYRYMNGIEDPQNLITSFVFDRFNKNTTYSIGRTSDYLLDNYDIYYNQDDTIPSMTNQHYNLKYSREQIIDIFSNYKYIYNFSE